MTPRTMAEVFIKVVWLLAILVTIFATLSLLYQTSARNDVLPRAMGAGAALLGSLIIAIAATVVASLVHIALAVAIAVFDIKDDIAELRRRGEKQALKDHIVDNPIVATKPTPTTPPQSIEEYDRQQMVKIRGRG